MVASQQQVQQQEELVTLAKGLIYDLKEALHDANQADAEVNVKADANLTEVLLKLKNEVKPDLIMGMLAPNLFIETGGTTTAVFGSTQMNLMAQESLSILVLLASSDPRVYLKPASRAIRTFLVSSTGDQESIHISDSLLQLMVAQLSGLDVEVSANATYALVAACRRLGPPLAERALLSMPKAWRAAWENKKSDKQTATTICVRCVHAMVQISCLSDRMFETATLALDECLVQAMIVDSSDDPLLQMSTLDLVETLATNSPMHGSRAQWLNSPTLVQPLLDMAGGSDDRDPDPILGGPALRLLSVILSKTTGRLLSTNNDAHFLTSFHHALRNFGTGSAELDRLAMIDAISSFAAIGNEALDIILQDTILKTSWLSLAVAQPKLKSVILHSVAMVLTETPSRDDDDAVMGDTDEVPSSTVGAIGSMIDDIHAMKLFAALASCNSGRQNTTELLLTAARSPLIELRLGSYTVITAVAKRGTGAQVLLTSSGFYEFLITRDQMENTKEGREAKYNIVVAVLKSDARGLLADKIVKALETYVKDGPHYVKTLSWELAAE
jgi:hypothetical protein